MNDEEKIPFTSHLEELRKRLITCFIAIGIGFVLAYCVKEWLFHRHLWPFPCWRYMKSAFSAPESLSAKNLRTRIWSSNNGHISPDYHCTGQSSCHMLNDYFHSPPT
ncbi:MAG: twin-arginine translocase subunit TatC [Deltaproteobacteria bacterium]|nr:twin-arginine translocase subunit TatC [Deltaproteobacteria bacterium]